MNYNRAISPIFMHNLQFGILSPFLARVKEDHTLMLALRGDYINIYYRGGSLFRIAVVSEPSEVSPQVNAIYSVWFDKKYNARHPRLPLDYPVHVTDVETAVRVLDEAPLLKRVMDRFLATHDRSEREFQQLVVRENNTSAIARETDYFIIDIEAAGILDKARFDMLAVRWLNRSRGRSGVLVPALVEMKYGIGSLKGEAGLSEHLRQICSLLEDADAWCAVVNGIEKQLRQLDELRLLNFNRGSSGAPLQIQRSKPEFIFLLANYNPASKLLKTFLEQVDLLQAKHPKFDLLFFVSCFAGYGMHRDSMFTFDEFRDEVSRIYKLAERKPQMGNICASSEDH